MVSVSQIMLVEKAVHHLLPGEATYSEPHHAWLVGCPGCGGIANLAGHTVTYDEDAKTLTAAPSILCGCGAHYVVEHNQIRWC